MYIRFDTTHERDRHTNTAWWQNWYGTQKHKLKVPVWKINIIYNWCSKWLAGYCFDVFIIVLVTIIFSGLSSRSSVVVRQTELYICIFIHFDVALKHSLHNYSKHDSYNGRLYTWQSCCRKLWYFANCNKNVLQFSISVESLSICHVYVIAWMQMTAAKASSIYCHQSLQ